MKTPTRICTRCLSELPATTQYFHKNAHCPNGLLNICKHCRSEKRKRQYRENEEQREKIKARMHRNYWRDPYHSRAVKLAYDKHHRQEAVERVRKWREANPERYHASLTYERRRKHFTDKRNYYLSIQENRRAQKLQSGGVFSEEDIARIYADQDGHCRYCGVSLEDGFHVDHVIPLSRGGSNSPDNLVLACPFCNISKGNRLPEEWRPIR